MDKKSKSAPADGAVRGMFPIELVPHYAALVRTQDAISSLPREIGDEAEAERLVALVDRTLAGDVAAWHALWKGLVPVIHAVAACPRWTGRLCRSEDDRDGIVVEVMDRLAAGGFEALRRFRDPEEERPVASFRKWIASVAIRACIDHVRAHPESLGRRGSNDGPYWVCHDPLPEADLFWGQAGDPTATIDARRLAERLGPELNAAQREALGLWLADVDHADIAAELGLEGEKAAERLVRAAIQRLRRHVAAEARAATEREGGGL
jgi:DNA-directed RNA polymerase specialized sigma24 family protein